MQTLKEIKIIVRMIFIQDSCAFTFYVVLFNFLFFISVETALFIVGGKKTHLTTSAIKQSAIFEIQI